MADAVTRAEVRDIIAEMREETGERFIALERKQEHQSEVLVLLRSLAARGSGKVGRNDKEV